MKLVSVEQMKALEKQSNQKGLTYAEMMANAGLGLAKIVHERFYKRKANQILGLVGSGNNGGDTLVALKHLAEWGWQTKAYLVKERERTDELLSALINAGGEVFSFKADEKLSTLKDSVIFSDCILDGILGTGIRLPLKGEVKKVLGVLSSMKDLPPVVAVDCPSGVDCNNGKAAMECLPACLTVCMAAVKQGLLKPPALELAGEIIAVDIGLADNLPAWQGIDIDVVDGNMVSALLPERPVDSHKGTFGTCMIVAGSINYCGAVLLASQAAYRVGAGLVRAAIPGAIYDTLAGRLPDATWLILPHTLGSFNSEGVKVILENIRRVDCMLLGPGWGQEDETLDFLKDLLNFGRISSKLHHIGFEPDHKESIDRDKLSLPSLVIDADGLKLLAKIDGWDKKIEKTAVLTPHAGEMSVLTGQKIEKIQANRLEVAREYAQKWKHVVVLKGALTVVADPSGKSAIIPVACSALSTAGTGDVLAGMIAGFIAQGLDAYPAASTAAWLHARAGVRAFDVLGNYASVIASDIIQNIAPVIAQIGG